MIAINKNGKSSFFSADDYLSNIISIEKETVDADVSLNQVTQDTDGDGLEDGYEIWDFKTKWNEKDSGGKYIVDSDGDGFPDSYEVFTLGTDPAVANETGKDSDGDGLTDLEEYHKGTDPWLRDSDFDNTSDRSDTTPRKTNDYTRQTVAAATEVHVGLYDRQYSETEDGVTYSYITNIYRGDVKKIVNDYGDTSLNKTMKYFYDADGNNTTIIEQYDEEYDPRHTQTICITYTYDAKDNVTFICDQWTKFTMAYNNNDDMISLKVGSQELIGYANTELTNNAGEDSDTSDLSIGAVIDSNENITTYGNGQSVKTVTTTYKVTENDTSSTATDTKVYYNDDTNVSYKTEYNSEGAVLKLIDYTQNRNNPIIYSYAYANDTTSVTRSDGFTKIVETEESTAEDVETESSNTSFTTTSYGFQDVKGENTTYSTSIATTTDEDGNVFTMSRLYNNDTYEYSLDSENDIIERNLYSTFFNRYISKNTQTVNSNTNTVYDIDIYSGNDKNIEYTYDLAGNITKIKINNEVKYEYSYDAHARLTKEKDLVDNKYYEYDYNETGNIQGKTIYTLDGNGNKISSSKTTIQSEYNNGQWPDQLTSYNNQAITYDQSGNPLDYINGMIFTWSRGRQLSNITFKDGSKAVYGYNENGLRTYKDATDETVTYEWDEDTLVRETVTYKSTNKTYDIWYFYDSTGNAIGYEYDYVNPLNQKSRVRVYYEKDLQGNVIGLLDASGAEIATYSYDAWGNITTTTYNQGRETEYSLNHITYRGYYRDEESGFYYLQSRYYDPEICRFVNADDISVLGMQINSIYKDSLYVYCNSYPVNNIDLTGYWFVRAVIAAASGVIFGGLAYAIGKKVGLTGNKLTAFVASFVAVGVIIGLIWGTSILKAINSALKPVIYFFKSNGVYLGVKILSKVQFEIHTAHHNKPIHFVIRWFSNGKNQFKEWWFGK